MNNNFDLIETMLWEDGGYFLPDLHVERLAKSAAYFSFSFDEAFIRETLDRVSSSFDTSKKYRVRLLLKKSGEIESGTDIVDAPDGTALEAVFSNKKIDKNDIFFRHKTTNRAFYDNELKIWRAKGFFDVIFSNQDEEITEGAVTNIIVKKRGSYRTPPVSSGLLPGVYRKYLLESGELPIEEKVLNQKDLTSADEIFMINSVRKMVPVTLAKS